MTNETHTPPAVLNLSDLHEAVVIEIERDHKKALAKLRSEFAAFQARAKVISRTERDRIEADLLDAWEKGEVEPSAILSEPHIENLGRRMHLANLRLESYHNYLERCAAPIAADLFERIAGEILTGILPGAVDLDAQAKAFGEAGNVAGRVHASIARHREQAEQLRRNPTGSLARLADYVTLES